jgi:hypothetical protein
MLGDLFNQGDEYETSKKSNENDKNTRKVSFVATFACFFV